MNIRTARKNVAALLGGKKSINQIREESGLQPLPVEMTEPIESRIRDRIVTESLRNCSEYCPCTPDTHNLHCAYPECSLGRARTPNMETKEMETIEFPVKKKPTLRFASSRTVQNSVLMDGSACKVFLDGQDVTDITQIADESFGFVVIEVPDVVPDRLLVHGDTLHIALLRGEVEIRGDDPLEVEEQWFIYRNQRDSIEKIGIYADRGREQTHCRIQRFCITSDLDGLKWEEHVVDDRTHGDVLRDMVFNPQRLITCGKNITVNKAGLLFGVRL